MAYIVMAYTVMAYVAHVVMAYTFMAYVVMAHVVMAYRVILLIYATPRHSCRARRACTAHAVHERTSRHAHTHPVLGSEPEGA